MGRSVERAEAVAALEAARDEVQKAKTDAAYAHARLETFLSKHFDTRSRPDYPPLPESNGAGDQSHLSPDPQAKQLEGELDELQAKRRQLLKTLTEVHPEVVEVDDQIATLESRLKSLAAQNALKLDDAQAASSALDMGEWSEFIDRQKRQSAADAATYQRLFDRWAAARNDLQAAQEAELAAVERLAALPLGAPISRPASDPLTASQHPHPALPATPRQTPPASEQRPDQPPVAALAATPAASSPSSGTQTLVLAALAVALSLAALAAVRLARSSADPLFASADEAAAALAIPVVGIVPALSTGRIDRAAVPVRKVLVLLAEVLLAVLVFSAVAYAIEHADDLFRFSTNPVTTLRSLFGL